MIQGDSNRPRRPALLYTESVQQKSGNNDTLGTPLNHENPPLPHFEGATSTFSSQSLRLPPATSETKMVSRDLIKAAGENGSEESRRGPRKRKLLEIDSQAYSRGPDSKSWESEMISVSRNGDGDVSIFVQIPITSADGKPPGSNPKQSLSPENELDFDRRIECNESKPRIPVEKGGEEHYERYGEPATKRKNRKY